MLAVGCGKDDGGSDAAGSNAQTGDDADDASDGTGSGGSDPDGTGNPPSTTADTTGGTDGTSVDTGESGTGTADSEGGSETGLPDDVEVWELRAGGYQPPVMETKYSCFSFTFPTDQLHHIVGFVPQVSSPMVHHYVLSIADSNVELDPDANCVDWPMHILWVWAPGVTETMLPPEAGFLVGDQGPEVTFILQVHYNNPLLTAFEDNDGLDIHVTRELRPERAGVFTQGDILSIYIPPGEPDHEYVATCASDVTAQLLPEPIHVFSSLLHAHALATSMWTEVERDGASMGEISRDDPFSFNTQQFQDADFTIEPGDRLQTHCTYDSSALDTPTQGGEDSNEEMCLNFMMYYPWVPSESCGVL
ncbi:MAG: hypothetical protein IAG13_02075 [Deltaproteobacteria bacterium]|nr:hypothetical protein [Nannocystaceae bacterium]